MCMSNTTQVSVDWGNRVLVVREYETKGNVPTFSLSLKIGDSTITGVNMKYLATFMTLIPLMIASAADAAGNVIDLALIGTVVWSSSDETIATIEAQADGSVIVKPTGKAGTVQISATGDSDPNTPEGFVGLIEITYLAGEVAVVNLQVGDVAGLTKIEPVV